MKRKKEKLNVVKPKKQLFYELKEYEKKGCRLYLNGKPSVPEKIVSACLREKTDYMRDFISDEQERIQKVDFIRVKEK
ncbi:MAG: hypothetical protein PHE06_02895 [Lachnospiraceae bacterium]|nr:hypothetical protein [Lachnospiraceae bacterium]MDD3794915.1 hypothetical protein [Lachnospiraceae bacterium]